MDSERDEPRKGSLFAELSRRNVIRVAATYAGISWVVLQIADVLFPALGIPDWTVRLVAALLVLGFPLAIGLAWAYELTPDGLRRDTAGDRSDNVSSRRAFDALILIVLLVAIGAFTADFVRTAKPADDALITSEAPEYPPASELKEDATIAVLPFVNMSSDADQLYFADGLTEELLAKLSRYQTLRVIGRTSSFQFRDRNDDLRRIGDQLGADYLLEGSVRKYGNSVRVTAQLVSAESGVNLWSNSLTRELTDIFALQEAIAGAVAEALQLRIVGAPAAPHTSTFNVEAYEHHLRALRASHLPGPANKRQALEHAKSAVDLDPGLAPAWVVIANAQQSLVMSGAIPAAEGLLEAREALTNALRLDPELADAHKELGNLLMSFNWDWDGAASAYARALELDPSNASALAGQGLLEAARGDTGTALELLLRSQRLEPLALDSLHNLALVTYFSRDYGRAESRFRDALALAGGSYSIGHVGLALTLISQQEFDAALAESASIDVEPFRLAVQALALHALGRAEEAEAMQASLISDFGDRLAVPISGNYAHRGDLGNAMKWLERAYEQRDAQLVWSLVHPLNDNLHGDPRYEALLDRLGLRADGT